MELSILVHCSGKAAAKLKALKVQEENELQMARELMGSGPPGSIDGMIPSSKDDFEKLSKAITEKVQMLNQSKHYNDFVEGLVKDLALDRKCEKVLLK
jgi:DNA polymerase II small subunit/DNA polymerase delta subunit B